MSAISQPTGYASPTDLNSHYNATLFAIRQRLARVNTALPCSVVAVTNAGTVAPVGFVDVQPLVNQLDGAGNSVPHGVVHHLPYCRLQGGSNAVIIDPQVGDTGLVVFCQRDISSVAATKAQANPGSQRRHDFADGVYVAACLTGTPTQFIQFNASGITILSPMKVTIQAPTVAVTGNLTVTGTIVAQGDITAGTVTLETHVHSGVTTGSGNTGLPSG